MSRKRPDADDLLRRVSLRRTPVRVGVIELLAKSSEPMGVPEMLEHLPRETDAVTVYRTLNTFTRKRLVHRVRGEDQGWRYALSTGAGGDKVPQHQHPHFVCEGCGAVQCLDAAKVPAKLVASMRIADGYEVSYAEVVLHGTCPRCR
jgi:Fur family transcriptional regulator, ferric uptake regulator